MVNLDNNSQGIITLQNSGSFAGESAMFIHLYCFEQPCYTKGLLYTSDPCVSTNRFHSYLINRNYKVDEHVK